MHLSSLLITAIAAATLPPTTAASTTFNQERRTAQDTCKTISQQVSNSSSVIYAGASGFQDAIHHWYTTSSQTPACVFEVGNADDASTALKILGSTKTPFAIKSGGHASNPGFSSTTGVHISLSRLNEITFSKDKSTVILGYGQTWADVYKAIEGSGRNVVGGRTVGPGLGGFTLGGGFSWKTNQFGLTCDTVKSYNLILPNGTQVEVDKSRPDLFFALKGGLNRFGLIMSAEYYTHTQVPQIFGGAMIYGTAQIPAVIKATSEFARSGTDPKAQIITTLEGGVLGTSALVLFFFDGPERPASFKSFDGILGVGSVKKQTFSSFVQSFPSNLVTNPRGTFHTLSTSKLTPEFIAAVLNETNYYGSKMLVKGGTAVSYDLEPFLNYGQHATDSAYPHIDSPLPLNLYFAWNGAQNDAFWYEAMRASISRLQQVAESEGIYSETFAKYPNYAITGTTAQELFGRNSERVSVIRRRIDPLGIMALAGGFDF